MEEGASMGSNVLREVEITILADSKCPGKEQDIQLCAGVMQGGKDSCQVRLSSAQYYHYTEIIVKFVIISCRTSITNLLFRGTHLFRIFRSVIAFWEKAK